MAQVLKEEVRNRILAAATTEFFESGYSGSSLRNIAKAAGITPGNLYRYFDGKDYIYEAVVGESYRQLSQILEEYTDNQVKINIAPTRELIAEMRKKNAGVIVSRVIQEVINVFGDNRMGLLILLRDDRLDVVLNTRFGLLNWFKDHFEVLYNDLDIAEYLAYSFTEGLIKIALEEDDNLGKRAETFVKFFFMRGVEDNE